MGSEKRERQKTARQLRIEAEEREARRVRRNRLAIRTGVAVAVVVGGLFVYNLIAGGDGDETAAEDDTSDTTELGPPDCSNVDSPPNLGDDVAAREAPDPEPPPQDTPAGALECTILYPGSGEGAAEGDSVTVNYVGKVPDGTVFDSSWENGQPFPVTLGQGQVIPGWDFGLQGARVGERRRLVIGSENAYGPTGAGDAIPPDSPLAFEVDIIDITPAEEASSSTAPAAEGGSSTTAPAAEDSSTSSSAP